MSIKRKFTDIKSSYNDSIVWRIINTILCEMLTLDDIYMMKRVSHKFHSKDFLQLYDKGLVFRGKTAQLYIGPPMIEIIKNWILRGIETYDMDIINDHIDRKIISNFPKQLLQLNVKPNLYNDDSYEFILSLIVNNWPSLKFIHDDVRLKCRFKVKSNGNWITATNAITTLAYIHRTCISNEIIRRLATFIPLLPNIRRLREHHIYDKNNLWIFSLGQAALDRLKILNVLIPNVFDNTVYKFAIANSSTYRYRITSSDQEEVEFNSHIVKRLSKNDISIDTILNILFP